MQLTIPAQSERRLWPRRKKLVPVFVAFPEVGDEPPQRTWVVDSSLGGVRLLVNATTEVGMNLVIRPIEASVAAPWIGVRVKNILPQESHQILGCEFVPPSWEAFRSVS